MIWVGRMISCLVLCCFFEAAFAGPTAEVLDTETVEMLVEQRCFQQRRAVTRHSPAAAKQSRVTAQTKCSGYRQHSRIFDPRDRQNGCGCPLILYDGDVPSVISVPC